MLNSNNSSIRRQRLMIFIGVGSLLVTAITIASLFTMGFFSKVFRKESDHKNNKAFSISHQESWAAYMTRINDDSVGSIIVDLGLRQIAPMAEKPIRLRVDVSLGNPNSDGLYSDSEASEVGEIDERIQDVLRIKVNSIYAGHLICDGKLYLYHYLSNSEDVSEIVSKTMTDFPHYTFATSIENDPAWKDYLELLYPEPIQMQSIQNSRVVENLRSEGDKLEKERKVEHWLYFKTEGDRERFIQSIYKLGFTIESKHVASMGDSPFALQISRFDKVDHQSVDGYTLDLWQKAMDANGEYDGWETEVVRD
ncbi:MAG: DUF695 domain-containing protein [Blastocatellia bacterium]